MDPPSSATLGSKDALSHVFEGPLIKHAMMQNRKQKRETKKLHKSYTHKKKRDRKKKKKEYNDDLHQLVFSWLHLKKMK
jgi:hypothetical protein